MEFEDQETFQYVRDHKKIAMKYFKSGWLIIDFVATFPFDKIFNSEDKEGTNAGYWNIIMTKMLRLTRLTNKILQNGGAINSLSQRLSRYS